MEEVYCKYYSRVLPYLAVGRCWRRLGVTGIEHKPVANCHRTLWQLR